MHNPLHGAGVAADVLLQAAQYCPFKAQCVVTTPHCAACAVVNTSMIACVAVLLLLLLHFILPMPLCVG